MNKLALIAVACALLENPVATVSGETERVVLQYKDGHSNRERIRFGSGARAREFELSLYPERNVNGEVIGLTVEMHCLRCRNSSINAMYGGHAWHGIQPFIFSIAAPNGLYGRRVVALPNVRQQAVIDGQRFRLCPAGTGEQQICEASVPITLASQ